MSVRFAGYAAVFDRVDRGGDVVRRGAFALPRYGLPLGSIPTRDERDWVVPLLCEHQGAPVGEARVLGEDSRGLRVIGRVTEPQAAAKLRAGLNGLSFGYRVLGCKAGAARELTVSGSVRVGVDGAEVFDWTLDPLGVVVFDVAPAIGAPVTAGFRFDVSVRFAEDRLDVNSATFLAGEAVSVPLIEVREA